MKNKPERWIALSVILCALALIVALGLVLGKFQFPNSQRRLLVDFTTVTGIDLNSPVKYAGAEVGRVHHIQVLSRKEAVSFGNNIYSVQVELALDPGLDLGSDLKIAIKQDGLLGSRFISLIPGRPDAPTLDDKTIVLGETPVELDDLLPMAQTLIAGLEPTITHLNSISGRLDSQLPQLMTELDSVLNGGSGILNSVNTPESKAELTKILRNLAVVSDNLKIVTTQAKGITSTLGEKPWRLIWGGVPTKLPTEEEILLANKALPVGTQAAAGAASDRPKSP